MKAGLSERPAKMNLDLTMREELLKKTGAGNLFRVFGEPDIDSATTPNRALCGVATFLVHAGKSKVSLFI